MSKAVHRHSDKRSCGASTVVSGQGTVFINGKLASVQGDKNTHGSGALKADSTSGTVFVNGKKVVAISSNASPDKAGHINPKSSQGSGDVFIG